MFTIRNNQPKITAKRGEPDPNHASSNSILRKTKIAKTHFNRKRMLHNMRTLSPAFIEKANARRAKLSARARGRERDAVEMHEEGMTYQQIGDILAVSRQFAHVLVQRAYARENSEKGQTHGTSEISTGTD